MSLYKTVKAAADNPEKRGPVKVTVEKAHNGGFIAETRQGYGEGIKTAHKNEKEVAKHISTMCK